MSSKILLRRGTAAQWSSANPILGIGELGIETDTLKIKIGNGSSTWSQLSSYANVTPAQLTSEINNLISAAPATLDTLNELAAAINNDASFSTTVNNLLTGKVSKSGGDTITSSTASTVGLIVKAAASQTANLTEWQDSAGTVLAKVASSGALSIAAATANLALGGTIGGVQYLNSIIFDSGNSTNPVHRIRWTGGGSGNPNWEIGTNTGLQTNKNWFVRYTEASPNVRDYIPLRIQGTNGTTILSAFSGQTANLQEWQNSDGVPFAWVTPYGNMVSNFHNGNYYVSAYNTGSYLQMDGSSVYNFQRITTSPNFIVRAAASQTADLQQWQNSAGTTIAKVDSSGNITAADYKLSNSLYNIKKTLKKTIDPAQNAIAGNTYDLFQIGFATSLQGIFTMQVSIRNGGYGQSMSYTLPATYRMDWLNQYGVTNPFFDGVTSAWVDLTPITFAPRHLMTNDYLKFQARIDSNTIYFRIKLTGQLTSNPLFDVYIQHSEEFANSTVTELSSTGTDFTTSGVLPNFLSSKAGTTAIFNPLTITSSVAATVPLVIKAATSQTANLQQWQNSSGAVLASINSSGNIYTANGFTTPADLRVANGLISYGYDNTYSARIGLVAGSPTNQTTLIVRKYNSTETGDIQQWHNSAGTVLSGANALGQSFTGSTTPILVATGGATTAASGNGTTATITTTSAHGLAVGDLVTIAGVTPTGYNATALLTAVTSTTISYLNATTGAQTIAGTVSAPAQASVTARSAGTTGLIVKGAASQTGNLQEWQDSTGAVATKIDSIGGITFTAGGNNTSINGQYGGLTVRNTTTAASLNTSAHIHTGYAAGIGLIVRGSASQTANLQEWQNSAGTVLLRVNSAGQIQAPQPTSVGLVVKAATTLTATITNAVGDGTTVTYTAANTFTAGQTVGVTGVDPVAYNLTSVTIASASSTQFTVTNAATGTYVSGGTASVGQSANIFESRHGDGSLNTYIDKNGQLSAYASGTPLALSRGGTNETNISFFNNAWARSLGQIRAIGTSDGAGFRLTNSTSANEYSRFTPTGVVFGNNIGALSSLAQITAYANSATTIGSVIRGAASQTAGLQQWQNSSGTVLAEITASGSLELNGKDIELMNIMGAF